MSTSARLVLAFLAVLAPFAIVVVVTFSAFAEVAAVERDIQTLDHGKHAGHIAASHVREQYIHQAHTLIVRDLSHVEDHYDAVVAAAQAAVRALESHLVEEADRADAREIVRLATLADHEFRRLVVPDIQRNDIETALSRHASLAATVDQVVAINEALNRRLEERSAAAHHRAEVVRKRARATVAWCFAVASLVAIAVATWTTRVFTRRVGALRDGAALISQGQLETRIRVNGRDELSQLAAAMNEMAASLRSNQELSLKHQRLASIGQVAAGVAHEINNPLGVILGYAKLLQRAAPSPAIDDLRIIETEARQCQRIVAGLLELARPRHLALTRTNVTALIFESIDRIAPERRDARQITLLGATETALVEADESQLRQVFDNALANALEATAADGRIEIEVKAGEEVVEVTVTDNGIGIGPEAMPRIFEPFFTTKSRGTGLGLAICQSIIDAHEGSISVAPAAPGTVLTIRLPRGGST